MRILLGLILTTFCACGNLATEQDEKLIDNQQINNLKTSVSLVDGKYKIDTAIILSGQNLPPLINSVENADLREEKALAKVPSFIKYFLDSLTNNFTIANPGENWQVGCLTITDNYPNTTYKKKYDRKTKDTIIVIEHDNHQSNYLELPARQLIYFGLDKDIALMTYFTGGIGKSEHIIIIKFEGNKIIDFWCGVIPMDLTSKEKLLNFLKANIHKEWGLNTNIIYI